MKLFFFYSSDVGIQDRVVIQELIKNVAQVNQLDSASQKNFKGFKIRPISISVTIATYERCLI